MIGNSGDLRLTDSISPCDRPPEGGEIVIRLLLAPVSLQAKSAAKEALRSTIRDIIRDAEYILSGDVQFDLEWLVHESARYDSDRSPDLDNIFKPILDALCGPDGLLVDDCQVQAIAARWMGWARTEEMVTIRIRFPCEWWPKKGLHFVQFEGGLCMPFDMGWPVDAALLLLEGYRSRLAARKEMVDQGVGYYTSNLVMPIQRVFHRTRLSGFRVFDEPAAREIIEAKAKMGG